MDLSREQHRELEVLLKTNQGTPARTLNELLREWATLVDAVERGYESSIYEYTNDLTVRDVLDRLAQAASPGLRAQIEGASAAADERFAAATEEAARPLRVGSDLPAWWRRVPTRRVGELADDLAALGHV